MDDIHNSVSYVNDNDLITSSLHNLVFGKENHRNLHKKSRESDFCVNDRTEERVLIK